MDVYTAIRTMRAVRQYTDAPISDQILTRILQAGRWAGSAKNTQPWQFIVIQSRATMDHLSYCGTYASHLREAQLAIVVVTPPTGRADFDSGRAIQNMMLAAWGDGVGSCIASMHQEPKAKQILDLPDNWKLQQVIAFGYPQPGVVPMIEGKPLKGVLATLGRKQLDQLVHHEKWQGEH